MAGHEAALSPITPPSPVPPRLSSPSHFHPFKHSLPLSPWPICKIHSRPAGVRCCARPDSTRMVHLYGWLLITSGELPAAPPALLLVVERQYSEPRRPHRLPLLPWPWTTQNSEADAGEAQKRNRHIGGMATARGAVKRPDHPSTSGAVPTYVGPLPFP